MIKYINPHAVGLHLRVLMAKLLANDRRAPKKIRYITLIHRYIRKKIKFINSHAAGLKLSVQIAKYIVI